VGVKEVERDEFDEMAEDKPQNVRKRISSGDNLKIKQRADSGGSKTKQAKLNFKPVDKKPKRNPWSDIDSDEDISDFASSPAAVAVPSRLKPARTGTNKMRKYAEDSADEEEQELRPVAQEEDSQESLPVPKKAVAVVETVDLDEEDEDAIADAVGDKFDVSSSDEEILRKVVVKKPAPRKLGPSVAKESTAKVKMGSSKPAFKKAVAVKKKFIRSSDDEKPVKKAKGRQVVDSGDDSDFEVENIVARPRTTGVRKKATVNYGQGDSSDSDF